MDIFFLFFSRFKTINGYMLSSYTKMLKEEQKKKPRVERTKKLRTTHEKDKNENEKQ